MPSSLFLPALAASDVLYDVHAAVLFPKAVAAWLASGGCCVVSGPVRDVNVQATFLKCAREAGLRYAQRDVANVEAGEYRGVRARKDEYEDGYKMVYLEHADSPAGDRWWREGLEWQ